MEVLFSAAPSSVYGCGKHANKGLGCVPSARQVNISSYCTDFRPVELHLVDTHSSALEL